MNFLESRKSPLLMPGKLSRDQTCGDWQVLTAGAGGLPRRQFRELVVKKSVLGKHNHRDHLSLQRLSHNPSCRCANDRAFDLGICAFRLIPHGKGPAREVASETLPINKP